MGGYALLKVIPLYCYYFNIALMPIELNKWCSKTPFGHFVRKCDLLIQSTRDIINYIYLV